MFYVFIYLVAYLATCSNSPARVRETAGVLCGNIIIINIYQYVIILWSNNMDYYNNINYYVIRLVICPQRSCYYY